MTLHFEEIVGGSTSNSPLRHEGQHLPLPPQQRHIHDSTAVSYWKKIGIKQEANEKRNKNKKDKNLIHTFLFILSNWDFKFKQAHQTNLQQQAQKAAKIPGAEEHGSNNSRETWQWTG